MFAFLLRRRVANIERRHRQLLTAARDLQRAGDLRAYAQALEQADRVAEELERARAQLESPEPS